MLLFPQWGFAGGVAPAPLLPACRAPQWGPPEPHCFAVDSGFAKNHGFYPSPYTPPQSDEDSRHSSCSASSIDKHADWQCTLPSSPSTSLQCTSSQRIAQGSAPFECRWRECTQAFVTLDNLSQHVSSNHAGSGRGGLFFCGWEGCVRSHKGFNARYKMLVHVRTHTNEKPHKCSQCEKSFSRAENLKIHVRSHSGEKPYACPVEGCNKAYSNSSDRFKHTRTHSVDKPYFCKVAGCEKRYTDPSSLRKHVKTYKHFASPQRDNPNLLLPCSAPTYQYSMPPIEDRVPSVYCDLPYRTEYVQPIDTYIPYESEVRRSYETERYRSLSYSEGVLPPHLVHVKMSHLPSSCPQLPTVFYHQTLEPVDSTPLNSEKYEETIVVDDQPPLVIEQTEERPLNLKRRSTSESAIDKYENGALNLEKRPRLSLSISDMPLDLSNKN